MSERDLIINAFVAGAQAQYEGYYNPPSREEIIKWPALRDFFDSLATQKGDSNG